jgi:putative transposase
MRAKFEPMTDSQWQFTKDFLDIDRKRKYDLRLIFDAIRWLNKTGLQWRELEQTVFPKWQITYYYFRKWKKKGIFFSLLRALVKLERVKQHRQEEPSIGAIDSQTVKKAMFVSQETGIDGNKKINGRKRHIIVDSLGLPITISVTAANVYDGNEGKNLIKNIENITSRLTLIRADDSYKGSFTDQAKKLGYRVKFGQKPESARGFVPQKGRWQVACLSGRQERAFAWLNPFRRLSKDYEKTKESSVSFIEMAYLDIILGRIP